MPAKKSGPTFLEFIWNGEEKKFLGRTGTSWLKIGVFYVIFYACLVAFWSACLVIFLQTINYREPRWTTDTGSIIGSNPGLGYRPGPPEDSIDSTLITFNDGPGENWVHWVKELTNVTQTYAVVKPEDKKRMQKCDYGVKLEAEQFCEFDVSLLGDRCTEQRNFGYEAGKPCIIVKLNNIFGWTPEVYPTVDDLPEKMPKAVKDQIARDFADPVTKNITKQNVWITCEGENPNDFENIGDVAYYPQPGMPKFYYPFKNVEGYRSPLVAVEFGNIRKGVLINIECKAWAKNIVHDRKERRGSMHLELMVD